jgi:hypothetical protein
MLPDATALVRVMVFQIPIPTPTAMRARMIKTTMTMKAIMPGESLIVDLTKLPLCIVVLLGDINTNYFFTQ